LGERRAQKEVLLSLGSANREVFAEAARAAVLIEARGAVAALLGRLATGSEVRAASRALALAGPAVIDDLIGALPTTRGQGAPVATSIASGRNITGTVRAARILAQLGPEAVARVLRRYADLGYRARTAVARALATGARRADEAAGAAREAGERAGAHAGAHGAGVERDLVHSAMELTLHYAESLTRVYPRAPEGLLRREVRRRIEETAARLLDLSSVIGDRDLITRARAALADPAGRVRERGHALELLENVLPRPLAARAVALLEIDWSAPAPEEPADPPPLDGWLEKCRAFDAGELASRHPMSSVLEKVLVLVDASLFTGLSGEELYPVAEIAEAIDLAPGDDVVKQGDPGDALFVVARGELHVVRDGARVRELGPRAVFGELALLDGAPRAATVTAASAAQVLRIPRAEFEALLDESPELARGVIRTLLGHLRGTSA
ncbi:MAG: cyclic nucleotide-binding domain-containing protein, partial [Polyangiaceae bacterium]|nr:cyclic nucleotide-binding domain-containing protein [Polyangiaceae bacterium]